MNLNNPAEFEYIRELLGLSMQEMAGALGVQLRTARRWAKGVQPVSVKAGEVLDSLYERHMELVNITVDDYVAWARESEEPLTVRLKLYRTQEDYDTVLDARGEQRESFHLFNSISRDVATILQHLGVGYEFSYVNPEKAAAERADDHDPLGI